MLLMCQSETYSGVLKRLCRNIQILFRTHTTGMIFTLLSVCDCSLILYEICKKTLVRFIVQNCIHHRT